MSGIKFLPDTNEARKRYNQLARETFKHKLFAELLTDMSVCELEGWNKLEFLDELISDLQTLRRQQ